jgi:peptidoglycan/LPS O-acetylase OafA/YrhL
VTKATNSFYLALPIVVVVVTLLAIGVHVLVEKPSMEMGRRLAGLPRFRRDEDVAATVSIGQPAATGQL